jgi:hypothetical protein
VLSADTRASLLASLLAPSFARWGNVSAQVFREAAIVASQVEAWAEDSVLPELPAQPPAPTHRPFSPTAPTPPSLTLAGAQNLRPSPPAAE